MRVSQVGMKFGGVGAHVFGQDAGSRSLPGFFHRLNERWRRKT